MSTQHTPGPWMIWPDRTTKVNGYDCAVVGSECHAVASIHEGDTTTQANARLIAASPDLLNMLQRLMDEVMSNEACFCHVSPLTLEHARAAIAKATKGASL